MAEETPQIPAEHPEPIQSQPEQAPADEQDALVQGIRIFFQRLRDQQHEHDAAREQGLGL
jgi:hypothetical protein